MVRTEIGTLRQRIRHRSFTGVAFDREDIDRLVEYVRPAFFRGTTEQEGKERIRLLLMNPGRKVELPDYVWSGFFLQVAPYIPGGPQDPTEVMIRLKIDLKTPLKDYRVQLGKALDILIYEKNLRIEIFNFILAQRKAFQSRTKAFLSEQSFYDSWFRYVIDVREDELQAVLISGSRGREKWQTHFSTSTPYMTRLPDHAILTITLRLLDEIGCAPDDPDTLKIRFNRWKKQASAR